MLCVKDECFVDHKTDKLEKDNSANKLKWSCNVRATPLVSNAKTCHDQDPARRSVCCFPLLSSLGFRPVSRFCNVLDTSATPGQGLPVTDRSEGQASPPSLLALPPARGRGSCIRCVECPGPQVPLQPHSGPVPRVAGARKFKTSLLTGPIPIFACCSCAFEKVACTPYPAVSSTLSLLRID